MGSNIVSAAVDANYKIVLMGTPFSHGNRGVAALAASLVELCQEAVPRAQIQFHLQHKPVHDTELRPSGISRRFRVFCCRMSPRSGLSENLLVILFLSCIYRILPLKILRRRISSSCQWIGEIESAGFVGDIWGGDSFSDIYGVKRFLYATLPVLTVILIRGSIVQLPQTYGPFKSVIARVVARFLLSKSSIIVARDRLSREVACELTCNCRDVLLSPDVAFALHSTVPDSLSFYPSTPEAISAGTIGININALMYHGGYGRSDMFELRLDYREFVTMLIETLLESTDSDLLLIPHVYAPSGDIESDNDVSRNLLDSLAPEKRHRIRMIDSEYDQHDLKGIIGQCDFFIGSRMHSCIAALSQGVPCVGVAYSMKFSGVFNSVGMNEWVIDGRTSGNEEATGKIVELYRKRNDVRVDLAANAAMARKELSRVFSSLFSVSSCVNN